MDNQFLNAVDSQVDEAHPIIPRNLGVIDFNRRVYSWGSTSNEMFAVVKYSRIVLNNIIDFFSDRFLTMDPDSEDWDVVAQEAGELLWDISKNLKEYLDSLCALAGPLYSPSKSESIIIGKSIVIRGEDELPEKEQALIFDPTKEKSEYSLIIRVHSTLVNVEAIEAGINSRRIPEAPQFNDSFMDDALTGFYHDMKRSMQYSERYENWLFKVPGVPPKFLFLPLADPDVEEVHISLYRTGGIDSFLFHTLCELPKRATVHVFIEVTARGNEKENQKMAELLQYHGCIVHTNYLDLKMHMKSYLVKYKSGHQLAMIGTGNYNEKTMQSYVDYHLMTMNPEICNELALIYFIMEDPHRSFKDYGDEFTRGNRWIYVSPISLRDHVMTSISRAKNIVFIKCNHLCDKPLVEALRYYQHQNGYHLMIDCRTSCSLLPEPPGIEVRSHVGQFLEHSRVYAFDNEVYISSADFLMRNMNKRVELMVRIPKNTVEGCIEDLEFTGFRWNVNEDSAHPIGTWLSNMWKSCNFVMNPVTGRWDFLRKDDR